MNKSISIYKECDTLLKENKFLEIIQIYKDKNTFYERVFEEDLYPYAVLWLVNKAYVELEKFHEAIGVLDEIEFFLDELSDDDSEHEETLAENKRLYFSNRAYVHYRIAKDLRAKNILKAKENWFPGFFVNSKESKDNFKLAFYYYNKAREIKNDYECALGIVEVSHYLHNGKLRKKSMYQAFGLHIKYFNNCWERETQNHFELDFWNCLIDLTKACQKNLRNLRKYLKKLYAKFPEKIKKAVKIKIDIGFDDFPENYGIIEFICIICAVILVGLQMWLKKPQKALARKLIPIEKKIKRQNAIKEAEDLSKVPPEFLIDYAGAKEFLEQAPTSFGSLIGFCRYYYFSGDYQKALFYAGYALSFAKANGQDDCSRTVYVYDWLSRIAKKRKDYDSAVSYYGKLIECLASNSSLESMENGAVLQKPSLFWVAQHLKEAQEALYKRQVKLEKAAVNNAFRTAVGACLLSIFVSIYPSVSSNVADNFLSFVNPLTFNCAQKIVLYEQTYNDDRKQQVKSQRIAKDFSNENAVYVFYGSLKQKTSDYLARQFGRTQEIIKKQKAFSEKMIPVATTSPQKAVLHLVRKKLKVSQDSWQNLGTKFSNPHK